MSVRLARHAVLALFVGERRKGPDAAAGYTGETEEENTLQARPSRYKDCCSLEAAW